MSNTKLGNRLLATTILSLGCWVHGGAQAQPTASTSTGPLAMGDRSPSRDAGSSGEIVVTARKQTEVLSKVGLSITAATGTQLTERGITTVAALAKLEPSFQFSKTYTGTPILTIRGIGFGDNSIQAPLAVSVYQDEVPHPYGVMTKGAMLDVQQVEILKGPQGTLYGQNSTGGAINFIANKPTDHFTAGVTATYSNYNAAHFDGYVSGPLTDTLTARLAASTDQGGAWQHSFTRDDRLGDKRDFFGRLLLDWKPSETFNAVLNVNGWRDTSDTQAAQLSGFFVSAPQNVGLGSGNHVPTTAQIAAMPAYASEFQQFLMQSKAPSNDSAADWRQGTHPRANESFYQADLRMDWTVSDAFGLTSLSSFQHYSQHDNLDLAGVGGDVLGVMRRSNGLVNSFLQELRAHGTIGKGNTTWQVGTNFSHDKSNQFDDQLGNSSSGYLTGFPPTLGVNPPAQSATFYSNNTTRAASIFANVSIPVLQNLKVNAGIRYTDVKSSLGGCTGSTDQKLIDLVTHAYGNGLAVGGQCFTVLYKGGPSAYVRNTLHETNVPWRVGLEWQATHETLFYALVSKGFKAGLSPLLAGTVATSFDPIKQESVIDYEGGVKTRLFDNKLRLNADVFYYEYRDKQLVGRVIDPVFGSLSKLINIPRSHVFGAEASVVLNPITGLTLDTALSYLDSRVDSQFVNYDPYGDIANFKNEHFPFTPKWSGSGGARYEWNVNDRLKTFFSVRGSYQTKTASTFGQSAVDAHGYPSTAIKAYGLLDMSVGLEPVGGNWRLELWARNLTNTYYWTSVNFNGDDTVRLAGMPRTYGITVRYKY